MTQLPYIVFRETPPKAAIKMNDTKKWFPHPNWAYNPTLQ